MFVLRMAGNYENVDMGGTKKYIQEHIPQLSGSSSVCFWPVTVTLGKPWPPVRRHMYIIIM